MPCDGRLVRAHLIKQQVLLRELSAEQSAAAIASPSTWVYACGGPMGNAGHHGLLDHTRSLRIPFDQLPPATVAFAEQHGLLWWLEREYGGGPWAR